MNLVPRNDSPGGERPGCFGTTRRALPLAAGLALLLGLGGCVKRTRPEPVTFAPTGPSPALKAPMTPLSQVPFLMAHDAATTYRRHYDLLGNILPGQVQTQADGSFEGLLDCGVRAFDLRPCRAHDGRLYMHHGPVMIKYQLKDALEEIVRWAGRHRDQLILVYFSHCSAGAHCATQPGSVEECESQTGELLETLGITLVQSVDISYGEAVERARLPSGGLVLAVDQLSRNDVDLVRENYVASIQYCEGLEVKKDAVADLLAYMDAVATEEPSGRELVVSQAHWQDPYTTLVDGCLETVLEMERASQINRKVAEQISAGRFRHINLLEVDNACDEGPRLKAALDDHLARRIAGERR